MKEYRFAIRELKYNLNRGDSVEYFKTLKECKKELINEMSMLDFLGREYNAIIDVLENNIITSTKIIKGKEFIVT